MDNFEEKFVSPKIKARIIQGLLILFMLTTLARIGCGVSGIQFAEKIQHQNHQSAQWPKTPDEVALASEERSKLASIDQKIGLTSGILFLVSGILILVWNWNLRKNLRALAVEGLTCNNVDAVISFVVPFYCFIAPYRPLQETFKASNPEYLGTTEWKNGPTSTLIRFWWMAWLLINLINFLSVGAREDGIHSAQAYLPNLTANYQTEILHAMVHFVFAILTFYLVSCLTNAQEIKYAKISTDSSTLPRP